MKGRGSGGSVREERCECEGCRWRRGIGPASVSSAALQKLCQKCQSNRLYFKDTQPAATAARLAKPRQPQANANESFGVQKWQRSNEDGVGEPVDEHVRLDGLQQHGHRIGEIGLFDEFPQFGLDLLCDPLLLLRVLLLGHSGLPVELLDDRVLEEPCALLVGEEVDVEEASGALAGAVNDSDDALVEVLEYALLDEFCAFVVVEVVDVVLVGDHLQLGVEHVEAALEVDGHALHHVEVLHAQLLLRAEPVLEEVRLAQQLEQRRGLRADVVHLREVAGLVVAQQEALVEAGNRAVVHLPLVVPRPLHRKPQHEPRLGQQDLVVVAHVPDVAHEHELGGRQPRGQAVPRDDEPVAVRVCEGQVAAHRPLFGLLLRPALAALQDHVEGLGHHAVVVDEADAQRGPEALAEVGGEPLGQLLGAEEEVRAGFGGLAGRAAEEVEEGEGALGEVEGGELLDGGAVLGLQLDLVPEGEGEGVEEEDLADLVADLQLLPLLAEEVHRAVLHHHAEHLAVVDQFVHHLHLHDVVLVPLTVQRTRHVHHHPHHRTRETAPRLAHLRDLLQTRQRALRLHKHYYYIISQSE